MKTIVFILFFFQLKQFVEDNFLDQRVRTIKEIGDKITKLQRYKSEEPGLGLQMFDSSLM